jgi:hypothetical protein
MCDSAKKIVDFDLNHKKSYVLLCKLTVLCLKKLTIAPPVKLPVDINVKQ